MRTILKLSILSFLVMVSFVHAQTYVSGSVSGTWTDSGNPYYVTDTITVEAGQTLTIGPGVRVYFQGTFPFIVLGTLNANGTVNDSILFTIDSESTSEFRGIRFMNPQSGGSISYARIEHGRAVGTVLESRAGGIYCHYSSPTISHTVVKNCTATGLGGGITLFISSSVVQDCEVSGCSATYGGGIFMVGNTIIRRNKIYGNTATNEGGGLVVRGDFSPTIENNLVYDNSSVFGGGLSTFDGSTGNFINNTIYDNSATSNGGGVYVNIDTTDVNFMNNVIWNNSATAGSQIYVNDGNLSIDYSDIQGALSGTATGTNGNITYGINNLNANPAFNDAANYDLHFEANSPLIDAGSNTGAPGSDLDGNVRPFDGDRDDNAIVDIGAYEYINTAPQITSTAVTTATEDNAYSYQVVVDDPDWGEEITYSLTQNPGFLSISTSGLITGTPDNDDVGTHPVTVRIEDLNGASDTQPYSLTVANTNDPPTVANEIPNQQATEDAAFSYQFPANTFNDVDVGDNLTYSATLSDDNPLPAWLSFTAGTRTFSGTPTNSNVGTITVKVTATDNSEASVSDEFDLQVINTNDPPTVANEIPNQQATEDAAFSYQFPANTFNDVDVGDNLTYAATLSDDNPLPAWLSFTPGTRTFSGTPSNADIGTITIKVTATDNSEASVSDEFDLQIINTNDPPTVANEIPDQQATEDTAFSYQFPANTFSDPDVGDNLAYSASLSDDNPLPAWLSFTAGTRTFSGTPTNSDVGTITIKVTATDNSEASVSDEFDLEVINTNDPPTVANEIPDQQATEDVAFSYQFPANTFNDVDVGDSLTYAASLSDDNPLPAWLGFTAETRTFSGTPDNSDVGTITVKVTATDDSSASISDEFDLTVDNVNDPPQFIASLPEIMFNEDESQSYAIPDLLELVNDPDNPDSTLNFAGIPGDYVTVELDSPFVVFSAPQNWFGLDTLTIIVFDPELLSDTTQVYITVNPVNDAPQFAGVPDSVTFMNTADTVLTMNDYVEDIDSPLNTMVWGFSVSDDTLKFDFDEESANLTLTAPNFIGVVNLIFTVTDDSGATTTDSFYVKVIADPSGIEDLWLGIPNIYTLSQNYPNPFNPITHIRFGLPKASDVKIELYNILGQRVATLLNEFKQAGYHVVDFNANHLPSGVYFYRIQAATFNDVKKMILVK